MSTICETILWLRSRSSGKRFPIAQFSADTDMATEGWISLSSLEQPEIVITQLTGPEFCAVETEGFREAEARVNSRLRRSDLRCSWFIRVEQNDHDASSTSDSRLSPRLLYRDIHSNGSVAETVATVSLAQFEFEGGTLTVLR